MHGKATVCYVKEYIKYKYTYILLIGSDFGKTPNKYHHLPQGQSLSQLSISGGKRHGCRTRAQQLGRRRRRREPNFLHHFSHFTILQTAADAGVNSHRTHGDQNAFTSARPHMDVMWCTIQTAVTHWFDTICSIQHPTLS